MTPKKLLSAVKYNKSFSLKNNLFYNVLDIKRLVIKCDGNDKNTLSCIVIQTNRVFEISIQSVDDNCLKIELQDSTM